MDQLTERINSQITESMWTWPDSFEVQVSIPLGMIKQLLESATEPKTVITPSSEFPNQFEKIEMEQASISLERIDDAEYILTCDNGFNKVVASFGRHGFNQPYASASKERIG